jgi:iron complex transport system substrate-binding protein
MKLARTFLICCAISLPAEAITVKDFAGREITLQQPAKRIVALAPHIVENLYSAGAGDALVGVVSYSNYPQEAKKIPRWDPTTLLV